MNFFKKLKESLTGNKTEDSVTSNQDTEKKSAEVLKKGLEKTKNSFFLPLYYLSRIFAY